MSIPFLVIAIYCMHQRGGLVVYGLLGLVVHLLALLLTLKFMFSCQHDRDSQPCVVLDPRTCFKLRRRLARVSCVPP